MRVEAPKPLRMGYEEKRAQVHAALGDDLWALRATAAKLDEFTAGRSRAEYEADEVLRAAVALLLGLMSEAAGRLERQSGEMGSRLGSLRELHQIASGLASGDSETIAVWEYLQGDLPRLLASTTEKLEAWHQG